MDLQLQGKRALVTGGSRGIGYAVAKVLAEEGASVAIAARNRNAIDEAVRRIGNDTGAEARGFSFDALVDSSVDAMVEAVVGEFGGVDILVNSAAPPGATPTEAPGIASTKSEYVLDGFDTKPVAYLRCARAVAPHMTSQGWGRIINISGLNARMSGSIIGSMRNIAVAALSKALADELGPYGVNVTTVHPGATRTENTSEQIEQLLAAQNISEKEFLRTRGIESILGRFIDATEIAWVVAFLASPRSVSITGDSIGVGGGTLGHTHY